MSNDSSLIRISPGENAYSLPDIGIATDTILVSERLKVFRFHRKSTETDATDYNNYPRYDSYKCVRVL